MTIKKRTNELLNDIVQFKQSVKRNFGGFFAPQRTIVVARAPGRIDVMGGVIDYSGGVVCEATLERAAIVGIQKRNDRRLIVRSLGIEHLGYDSISEINLDDFFFLDQIKSYAAVQRMLTVDSKKRWTGYVFGAFFVLLKEGYINDFPCGATIGINSSVPMGAGISSSAALEVATMYALQETFELAIDGLEMARLCQMVENLVVGAPCGIMDQVTSALGEENRLLVLKCQPHEILKMVDIPKGYRFVGISSGVKHSVGGSKYTNARIGTFMARKIIFDNLLEDDPDSWPYNGYLCNITPDEYQKYFRKILPARFKGNDFIECYQSLDDPATSIAPSTIYRVRSRAEHAIYENQRVLRFVEIIEQGKPWASEQEMIEAGELMYSSHWSYGHRIGLGSKETDVLVELVRKAGPDHGLYGAKISGGGCGGTVVILTADNTDNILKNIAARYFDITGLKADLFFHSSLGALEFGTLEIKID